jgi:hypothetical protein
VHDAGVRPDPDGAIGADLDIRRDTRQEVRARYAELDEGVFAKARSSPATAEATVPLGFRGGL